MDKRNGTNGTKPSSAPTPTALRSHGIFLPVHVIGPTSAGKSLVTQAVYRCANEKERGPRGLNGNPALMQQAERVAQGEAPAPTSEPESICLEWAYGESFGHLDGIQIISHPGESLLTEDGGVTSAALWRQFSGATSSIVIAVFSPFGIDEQLGLSGALTLGQLYQNDLGLRPDESVCAAFQTLFHVKLEELLHGPEVLKLLRTHSGRLTGDRLDPQGSFGIEGFSSAASTDVLEAMKLCISGIVQKTRVLYAYALRTVLAYREHSILVLTHIDLVDEMPSVSVEQLYKLASWSFSDADPRLSQIVLSRTAKVRLQANVETPVQLLHLDRESAAAVYQAILRRVRTLTDSPSGRKLGLANGNGHGRQGMLAKLFRRRSTAPSA